MADVIMPKWGLTMEDATLVEWLIEEGDRVTKDQVIANVETDKVVNDLSAPADGVVSKINVAAGTEEVKVGTVLCVIEED